MFPVKRNTDIVDTIMRKVLSTRVIVRLIKGNKIMSNINCGIKRIRLNRLEYSMSNSGKESAKVTNKKVNRVLTWNEVKIFCNRSHDYLNHKNTQI